VRAVTSRLVMLQWLPQGSVAQHPPGPPGRMVEQLQRREAVSVEASLRPSSSSPSLPFASLAAL